MQWSWCLVLIVGAAILLGVYVFADTNLPTDEKNQGSGGSSQVSDNITTSRSEILVKFNPELWNTSILLAAANASHAAIGAEVKTDFTTMGLPGWELVQLPPGMTTEEGIAYYQQVPYVLHVEENAEYSIESTPGTLAAGTETAVTGGGDTNSTPVNQVQLLVQFKPSVFADQDKYPPYTNQIHLSMNATLLHDYTKEGLKGLQLIELPVNMTAREGMVEYRNLTGILFAEPNYQVHL